MTEVSYAGSSMCPNCKRWVAHKLNGGPHKRHGCNLRWIARRIARAEARGFADGYRFALDNISDPMVYADLNEYGTGWAGLLDAGAITVHCGDTEEQP